MVWKKKGRVDRYKRPPPATPTHPLHLAHALYRGSTQGTTMRYVIECTTRTRRPRPPLDVKKGAWYNTQQN